MNTTTKVKLNNLNLTNPHRRAFAAPIARYDRETNRRAIAIARAAAIEVLG